ncbi:MAG: amino acid ABC transporter permease [Firmicutes bacterium]|nr:amino acid ABC transporter permease [Bacillota bacterium]
MNFWQYCLDALPLLLEGLLFTLIIFAIIVAIGFPLSVVVASLKTIGPKWLRRILGVYTWIFRGTPLLLQLFLVYYALPHLGIVLSPNTVIIIVYLLSVTAYESEVIRGGMAGIDNGQYEAAKALGMSRVQTMRRIITPQAIRKVLPTTCSEAIILIKDTTLISAVAEFDLLRHASNLVIMDMRIDAYVIALILYLIIASIITLIFSKLEKRYPANI